MGLCLICQAAVSSTLKFISEGPQSAVTVAPLATLSAARLLGQAVLVIRSSQIE
jgi:hypothetical protein